MSKYNQWIIKLDNGEPTEIVEYDDEGTLQAYKVWSDTFIDHIEVDLLWLIKSWPSKYIEISDKCLERVVSFSEDKRIDDLIDSARDSA